ncbi:hypothetical protein NV379_08050 [Paenibacillus sp. N1-5-1-14]|uniref:hypothetical protein n=1 Tax=Paenibacillus radicibacter TaxID=2972488 RepID=UPI0021590E82|nr:hypothetical protein [Paenibacillus radicibacter]MCR8642614.1 hypothetical protein [Paenibacillus radicibacter]
MAFCEKCGHKIQEGEVHLCNEAAATVAPDSQGKAIQDNPMLQDLKRAVGQIDGNKVLTILKNPQMSLRLDPAKDLTYGVLGIAASIVGFLIWAIIIQNKIEDMLGNSFGSLMMMAGGRISFGSGIAWKMFLLGILSLAALLGTVYIIGNWLGTRKLSFIEIAVKIGGMHLTSGAGFVLVGIVSLINMSVGFSLLMILLISALIWTVMGANQLMEVQEERRIAFIGSTIAVYGIVFSLLMKLFM